MSSFSAAVDKELGTQLPEKFSRPGCSSNHVCKSKHRYVLCCRGYSVGHMLCGVARKRQRAHKHPQIYTYIYIYVPDAERLSRRLKGKSFLVVSLSYGILVHQ